MNYRDISKSFIDFAYTQFHAYVKAVRIDNGSKFLSMGSLFIYFTQLNTIALVLTIATKRNCGTPCTKIKFVVAI